MKVCDNFAKYGYCNKGSRCRYAHVPRRSSQSRERSAGSQGSSSFRGSQYRSQSRDRGRGSGSGYSSRRSSW
jgi:hypothetical protein